MIVVFLVGIFLVGDVTLSQNTQPNSSNRTIKDKSYSKSNSQQTKTDSTKNEYLIQKTASGPPSKEQGKRGEAVAFGAMLLIGVLILGLIMISLILVWGRRTRRIAKLKGSKKIIIDPLWYLRSQKKEEPVSPVDTQHGPDRFDSPQS